MLSKGIISIIWGNTNNLKYFWRVCFQHRRLKLMKILGRSLKIIKITLTFPTPFIKRKHTTTPGRKSVYNLRKLEISYLNLFVLLEDINFLKKTYPKKKENIQKNERYIHQMLLPPHVGKWINYLRRRKNKNIQMYADNLGAHGPQCCFGSFKALALKKSQHGRHYLNLKTFSKWFSILQKWDHGPTQMPLPGAHAERYVIKNPKGTET